MAPLAHAVCFVYSEQRYAEFLIANKQEWQCAGCNEQLWRRVQLAEMMPPETHTPTGRQLAESHLVQPLQLGLHSHQSLGTRVNQTILARQRGSEDCGVGLATAKVAAGHAPVESVDCGGEGCGLGGEL